LSGSRFRRGGAFHRSALGRNLHAGTNLPLTAQRILTTLYAWRGEVVSYEDLYQVIKSGRNRDHVRKHVSIIREAFREIDPAFDGIENVPMRGFRWVRPAG
jgi:DNA-binding winged helix-turn-helix (wHTH) protein